MLMVVPSAVASNNEQFSLNMFSRVLTKLTRCTNLTSQYEKRSPPPPPALNQPTYLPTHLPIPLLSPLRLVYTSLSGTPNGHPCNVIFNTPLSTLNSSARPSNSSTSQFTHKYLPLGTHRPLSEANHTKNPALSSGESQVRSSLVPGGAISRDREDISVGTMPGCTA